MLYDISIGAGWDVVMMSVPSEKVEETIRNMDPQRFGYSLTAYLDASFTAEVARKPPSQDVVRLYFGNRDIILLRDSTGVPGDIGVSCRPGGSIVPVDSINIPFRSFHDNLTDRGLVWVKPGAPARMHFVIDRPALDILGLVTKLVADAEEAVRDKLLVHFAV